MLPCAAIGLSADEPGSGSIGDYALGDYPLRDYATEDYATGDYPLQDYPGDEEPDILPLSDWARTGKVSKLPRNEWHLARGDNSVTLPQVARMQPALASGITGEPPSTPTGAEILVAPRRVRRGM